jgi:hypothetical protein
MSHSSLYPPSVRIKLWLGNTFALGYKFEFVPDEHVQVIYREGHYWGVRGPGIIRWNRWNEKPGPLVYTGNQVREFTFTDVITHDVLPVTVRLRAVVRYHPKDTLKELARVLTHQSREAYLSIAETYLRKGLMSAVNRYNATEITHHNVTSLIEEYLFQAFPEDMGFLGLSLTGKPRILNVELPRTLAERHERIAQRQALIAATGGKETDPIAIRQALVIEFLENLDKGGKAESLINFNQMFDAFIAEKQSSLPSLPGDSGQDINSGQTPHHTSRTGRQSRTPPNNDSRL